MRHKPTPEQREVLEADDDLLVVGRPGSGKTTVALEKARRFIQRESPADHQQVLFLSFSRAAVHRIQVAAKAALGAEVRRGLHVTTFHGFCYQILTGHWRLLGLRAPFELLPSEEEKLLRTRFGSDDAAQGELTRLEKEEGRVTYDRFAPLIVALLKRVPALRRAYAGAYPLVLADEYQDTDDYQHEMVALLSTPGRLICLGDPDQRIYDFRPDFRHDRLHLTEAELDLRRLELTGNHRSGACDIVDVARAVLLGTPAIPKPTSVRCWSYGNYNSLATNLKRAIISLERHVRSVTGEADRKVSIAIMSYRNGFVGRLSSMLKQTDETFQHSFFHSVMLDPDEVAIAWRAVLGVLEPGLSVRARTRLLMRAAADLHRHRGGKTRIARASKLERWANDLRRGQLSGRVRSIRTLQDRIGGLMLSWSGDPEADGRRVRDAFRKLGGGHFEPLTRVLDLRPLAASSDVLTGRLAEAFAETGDYSAARRLGRQFLVQERMQLDTSPATGRVLMSMHKCKGKEFDGVIIVDGIRADDLIVYGEDESRNKPRSRRLLHVAISRARYRVYILTPPWKRCPLLPRFV